jgi:uncharacterized metal-binding protein YceD (DUF177 family)
VKNRPTRINPLASPCRFITFGIKENRWRLQERNAAHREEPQLDRSSGAAQSENLPLRIRLAGLPRRGRHPFSLAPDKAACDRLAQVLGVSDIRKLRFSGELSAEGKADWRLSGRLGATVVQPCVATLAPVRTRIEEEVSRLYLARWTEPEPGSETEMPQDDSAEAMPATLDLSAVMEEALALALPAFPRAEGAELGETGAAEASEATPFAAALAKLKRESGL